MQGQLSQSQREFYLREQLKAIQKELGEGDESPARIEELREKLEAAGMPEEVKTEAHARAEPARAHRRPRRPNTASRAPTWNGWPACRGACPPGRSVDVKRAAEILDEDHYDLEKVKDRILDYLAVLQLQARC